MTRIKLERIGSNVLILHVGDGTVAFTEAEKPRILELLQADNVTALQHHKLVNGKAESSPEKRVRKTHAAAGRRR